MPNIKIYKILWNTFDLLKGDRLALPRSELEKAASLPTNLTCSALSCTLIKIKVEQCTQVHPRFPSLQQICLAISGHIYSSRRSWEESRLLIYPLPTIYDPAHYSKCLKRAIPFVCKELWRNTAVLWPSRSTLNMLEPLFKSTKVSCMKRSQNKSLLKEFPNILGRLKQFWFSYLSGVSFLQCSGGTSQQNGRLTVPSSLLRSKLETHFENKTKELYMERLKGRRHTTEKHICN